MEISKNVKDIYADYFGDGSDCDDMCKALRDTLAELLTAEHKLHHWQANSLDGCKDCVTDKKAEAHKILMGER